MSEPDHRGPEPGHVAGGSGRHRHLRHPGRRHPAGVRPADGLHDPAHPGPARAGRRPRRAGVRRRDRPGGRLHGHVRAGCHQPGHPDRRRAHGLGADRGDHRPGRRRRDRHRRLPGGRHPRHHDADHQAQLPGHRPRRDPATDRRGVPHRQHRPPRTGARGHREVRAPGDDHLRVARRAAPARLPPGDPTALQADPRGGPADAGVAPAGALRRRWHDPLRRVQGAAVAGRADRDAGGDHADGPRRVPRQPPAAPRDARHARHRRRGRGTAEERPDHQPRRPLRRPGDRQPRHLRARRQDHPRRHRPGRDRQEPAHRRPDRRRRPRGAPRPARRAQDRGRDRAHRRLRGLGEVPRGGPRHLPARLRPARGRAGAAVRHRAARRDRRPGRDLHRRRRPAPDVGGPLRRLREAEHLDQLRRPRHHGLRRPGRDGRPGRHAATRWCGRSTATAASR